MHLHILTRVKLKGNRNMFMCSDPTCTWTRRKEFLLGKKFKCPYCSNEYLTTRELLNLRTPHCPDCTVKKEKPTVRAIDKMVQHIGDFA